MNVLVPALSERHNAQFIPLLFDQHPQPLWVYCPATLAFLAVNEAATDCYGYTRAEFLRMTIADIRPAEDVESLHAILASLPLSGTRCNSPLRHCAKNGSALWVEVSTHPMDWDGQAARLAVIHDVSERVQTEAALKAAESNYRSIFENALEGIFQTTPDGQYRAANPALARIYGYESPDDLRAHLTDIRNQLYVDPTDRERFAALMRERGYVSGFEAQIVRKNGSAIWIAEHARAVCDDDGELLYYEGTVQDISVRKRLEAERETLLAEAIERADRDPLTGLLNHRAFHKRLEEEADRAQRTGEPLTVAVMDLDNFKFFNDAYGHAAGDDVLRQVAGALSSVCRSYDTLARFGGDEFALLMPGTRAGKAAALVQRLTGTLERIGYRPPGYDTVIPLGLSVGVATFPDEAPARLETMALADSRLMRAKTGAGDDDTAADLRASLTDSLSGFSMLDALVTAVDNKDRYTRHHSEDVMTLCLQMARELKLGPDSLHTLAVAALLHDVGKIGVPDRILRKPGHLTDQEFQAVQQHPMMGSIIVGAVKGLEHTLDCIRYHHERWDGQGYPSGLRGDLIPKLARIMAVADAFSAITTDRPYRKGKRQQDALDILADGAGTQWDPVCVQALSRARRKLADACFTHEPSGQGDAPVTARPQSV